MLDLSKSVLIAGTFEIVHPGHLALIEEAEKHGRVTVVLARDSTVARIRKRPSIIPEKQRLQVIEKIKGVDKAILGHEGMDLYRIVCEIKPDLVVLGPNQQFEEDELNRRFEKEKLDIKVTRMKELYSECPYSSTSSIIHKILDMSNYFKP